MTATIHNAMLKDRYHILLGSFLVAAAFWFSVTMSGTFRAHYDVPLVTGRMPADLALETPLPQTVDVLLEADGWQLLFINAAKQLAYEIPGAQMRSGIILTNRGLNEMMQLPGGIKALRAYPETLFVSVDREITRRVPLRLEGLSMQFKEGFGLVREVQLTPDSITLRGARSVLGQIDSWPVQAKAYKDLSIAIAEDLPVKDTLRSIVRRDINRVELYIPTEQLADMWFRDVRVLVRHLPADREVLLERQTVDVSVRGGVNVLSLYSSDDFIAEIEFKDIVADTSGSIIPSLQFPAELRLLNIEPPAIRYTMRK